MKQQYSFITKWAIEAPLKNVWDAIYESTAWPQWWKGVKAVEVIKEGDENGIGGIRRYTWGSVLPYTLSFNMELKERKNFSYMCGVAFGELEGMGEWLFREENGVTYVQYNWNVHTAKAWMNYLSFLLKPAFKYNHDVVMRWGAEGLAKKLDAKLISSS